VNNTWLTLQDIADELKVHVETVREWIRNKQLVAYKFGRDYRVKREDFEQFVKERRIT
jgi:excisionase family DNA binding protein